MSATYFLLLTDHGSQRLAAAQAGTQTFQITHLAIGDANNLPYLPQSRVSEMTLVNEQARVPVQSVAVVGGQVEVVATVDSTIGGFNVHEIGLLDEAGQLLYIGNYHGGYKPILTEGAGGDLELVCVLQTSNLTPVVVEMNPTIVTANRQWVLDNFVHIPTFNAHTAQNNLEHANLLQLIQQLNLALATAQEKIMDTQTIQNIQSTLTLMNQRLTLLETQRERPLPIGTVIETTKPATFTAQDWAAEFGYNSIWAEDEEAAGRVIVGAGEVTIDYSAAAGEAARANVTQEFTVGETGGEVDHKPTTAELANHGHEVTTGGCAGESPVSPTQGGNHVENLNGAGSRTGGTAAAVGGGQPFNVMQPYLVRKKFVLTGYQTTN